MQYTLIEKGEVQFDESSLFLEGAVLAANLTTKPLAPETWLEPLLGEGFKALQPVIEEQIHKQHNYILRNEYSILALTNDDSDQLADFAEGFMSVWSMIEEQWHDVVLNDGLERMLQALLTTMMLAIDEEQTQQQMRDAGIETPPALKDFIDQLDLMINEVALGADELMVGKKSKSLNPFKDVGRNDPCPCDSGKKFKQCCGK
ncbi:SEC-C metal-binding domain-containing protein [Vibrio harveyi]|uniref:SEC-C metal-binding domain-containing protein n=1 Tax=Vibrio harveyi TaxID=669 RepID=UPI0003A1F18A|nr:SEC-C metal-binding domain-containing protein [Vibrio harveyi]ELH4836959.1 SEC-C domain-containing protein [Vibrio harveyi]MBY7702265.1 SEC-C domain-containing protein [Vibrio harveyi]PNM55071.1 prepilin peptidase [Vibrio harveyi]UIL58756.1 SEC-C domain-containing protein [Vibrio harveyi]SQA39127.1 prepilin peptidase [Vibrio harveyi]